MTCVQLATATCATQACSVTVSAVGSGHLLIVLYAFNGNGISLTCSSGITTNSGSDTWATVLASRLWRNDGTNFWGDGACYAANVASGTTSVTATLSSAPPNYNQVTVIELSGMKTSPLDKVASASASGCPATCNNDTSFSIGPTATLTDANEYAVCFEDNANAAAASSPTGGFSLENTTSTMSTMDKAVTATTALTCGGTLSGTPWGGIVATFEATSQPGAVRHRASVIQQ